jgi:hypothetical protein
MKMTPEQLGVTILAVSEVPNFLAGMLPSLFTIQTFNDDPAKVASLRRGEAIGGALALTVGAGASLVGKSWWPFIGCAGILVCMLAAYEHAIRTPLPSAVSMTVRANPGGPQNG